MPTRSPALLLLVLLAGCTFTLSSSDVDRIVSSALKARRSAKPCRMAVVLETLSGAGLGNVRYSVERDRSSHYLYVFEDGTRFWNAPDGRFYFVYPGRSFEIFQPPPPPSGQALRDVLTYVTSRWISMNRITVRLPASRDSFRGCLSASTPLVEKPLVARTEIFAEKKTGAVVYSAEFDAAGSAVRSLSADSLLQLPDDHVVNPPIPAECPADVYSMPGASSTLPLPGWASCCPPVLDVLSRPVAGVSDGKAVFDYSRGGFIFILFQRPLHPDALPMLSSPASKTFSVAGISVSYWWLGETVFFRWRSRSLENTVLTNVPPDMVFDFIRASVDTPSGDGER
ncbi:MAG: hypothetical protein JW909_03995 [Planctomycetes bacterium]|nr:hypothetical protein [Planctomycetota bacterium]